MSLNVAIVSTRLSRSAGGILPIMQNHAIELRRRGVNVSVFGMQDLALESDLSGWEEVPLQAFRASLPPFHYSAEFLKAIKDRDADIVHQHGLWQFPSVAVASWRRHTGRPVVISTQGMLEPWALENSRLKKRLAALLFERNNLRGASLLHCSEAEVAGVRAFGLRNPIVVLPNGVNLPQLESPARRPHWMPNDRRKTLFFLGRIHPKKGLLETIAGFGKFKERRPGLAIQWRLAIAGWNDGGHERELRAAVEEHKLGDDVVFTGPLFGQDKDAALFHVDAFILASHSEGFPMAVLEAWAYQLPVFMTPACNIPAGFRAGAAIELRPDPEQIADALARSLGRADLADVGLRGRELVANEYSWQRVVSGLLSAYDWLSARGPMPTTIFHA